MIDTAIDATHANASAAVAALNALAGECRQRAAVCEQYRSDMVRYRHLRRIFLDRAEGELEDMMWPIRPTAPDWAEWF